MNKLGILVIDDEPEMLESYNKILTREGYSVKTYQSAQNALESLNHSHHFSLVICDIKMPGMDGMEFLAAAKEKHPQIPVIMVTGYGTLESAIEAVKIGAFDFIEKPFSTKKLLKSISSALEKIIPRSEDSSKTSSFLNIIGKSESMKQIYDIIEKVSFGNGNVLLTGESGVGKELVARAIHKKSLRRNCPLIPINCGGFPDTLFESELFGYEKGAFTGAFQSKPGLVELAHGGTLFLDEICETSQALQVKMLRMLENHKIRRIGGKQEISVDLRVVSATNRNIDEVLTSGLLREDLFYRINTIQITIPPLRERTDDIPLLIRHFLNSLNEKYNRQIHEINENAMDLMKAYSWPGNVRELQNVVERSYYLATPPAIKPEDLPSHWKKETNNVEERRWENIHYKNAKEQVIEKFEHDYLLFKLNEHDWNISRTADACEMDRRTLHRLIKRYSLKR